MTTQESSIRKNSINILRTILAFYGGFFFVDSEELDNLTHQIIDEKRKKFMTAWVAHAVILPTSPNKA